MNERAFIERVGEVVLHVCFSQLNKKDTSLSCAHRLRGGSGVLESVTESSGERPKTPKAESPKQE
jgi:hypothetical protein